MSTDAGSLLSEAPLPEKVEIYDTTLRDGAQLEGISLTVDDKLRIAEQLDRLDTGGGARLELGRLAGHGDESAGGLLARHHFGDLSRIAGRLDQIVGFDAGDHVSLQFVMSMVMPFPAAS